MRQRLVRRTGLLVVAGLVVTLLAPVARAQEARTIDALAARLKVLEDKEAIAAVLIAYGRALDSRDFKTYASLFSKDGSWSGGLQSDRGTGRDLRVHDEPDRRRQRKRSGPSDRLRSDVPHHVELRD